MKERGFSTPGRSEPDAVDVVGPRLTVHVAGTDIAAEAAAPTYEFLRRVEEHEEGLARGFDRLLALDDLDLKLYPHQRAAALRVLRDMRGRALLADEVGLGKTIEAGVIAREYILRGLARKLLVLAPASLIGQWRRELSQKVQLPCRLYAAGTNLHEDDRLIASLDTARRPDHAAALQQIAWDIVIVDEAHRLKNRRSVSWRFVDGLQKKYLLLLTATPIQNDLEELYNMMTLLHPGSLKTYREFRREHVAHRRRAKQEDVLRARIARAMVRTTRSEGGLHMPRRIVRTLSVPLRPEEKCFYDDVTAFAREAYARTGRDDGSVLTFILLLRELCSSPEAAAGTLRALKNSKRLGGPDRRRAGQLADAAERFADRWSKLDALVDWLEEAGEAAVAFTQFRGTQNSLARRLAERGLPVKLFHGGMDEEQRRRALDAFRRDGGVLLSTEAGSEGQNLQFCRLVVNCDLPWNPMRVEQRIGRVHRLGQARDVIVVNAVAPDTMEMHVFRLLQDKIKLFEQVIGELDVVLARPDDGEGAAGAGFVRRLGLAFLEAVDEEDSSKRVDAIAQVVTERSTRLMQVRRLNDKLLPVRREATDGRRPEDEPPAPVEGQRSSGRPIIRRGELAPIFTSFIHPLSLDASFAAAALAAGSRPAHPLLEPWRRRAKELQFVGGRVREAERRLVHPTRWLFWFRVAYRSDETWEALHVVVVDPLTETAAFADFSDPVVGVDLDAAVASAEGFGGGTKIRSSCGPNDWMAEETAYAARRTYGAAARFIRNFIEEQEGRQRLAEAEARLARDARRLERFYEGLTEEAMVPVVQKLRRMERDRTRASWRRHVFADGNELDASLRDERDEARRQADEIVAGLQREQRRRLEELAAKYSVRAEATLVAGARMTAPRVKLIYKLMAPARRDIEFYFDPLTGVFVDLECERCGAPLETVRVAASGDLLCAECAAPGRASGV